MPFARTEPLRREIEARIPERPFSVEFWDGTKLPAGNGDWPTFHVRSPRAVAHALLAPGQLGLGRAYVSGERTWKVGPAPSLAGSRVPSQNSTVQGRSGMRASISRRRGSVRAKGIADPNMVRDASRRDRSLRESPGSYASCAEGAYDRRSQWQAAVHSHPTSSRSPTRPATGSSPVW